MNKFTDDLQSAKDLQNAFESGNKEDIQNAFTKFQNEITERATDKVKSDIELYKNSNNDMQVLANRGYRTLTSKETDFYNKLIDVAKSPNPQDRFTTIVADNPDMMETTIIEDVYRELKEEHQLLSKVNFKYVGFLTKTYRANPTMPAFVWGPVTKEKTEEISTAFIEEQIVQNKVTAFILCDKAIFEMGPSFIDAYIHECLKEYMYAALETAIISGTGNNMPIGLDRDISKNVSVTGGVYPKKAKEVLNSISPETYNKLIAKIAKTENGTGKTFTNVSLIVNQVDYLSKILPATQVRNVDGTYSKDIFPFPTDVIISNSIAEGEAILCLLDEYFIGLGSEKNNIIDYDDSVKWFEDQRAFSIKQYANGKGYDNNTALLLDISNLEPTYLTVNAIQIPQA